MSRARTRVVVAVAAALLAVVSACELVGVPPALAAVAQPYGVLAVPIPAPATQQNKLASVSCTTTSFCVAVGVGGANNLGLAESWDGSSWAMMTVPTPTGGNESSLTGVSCLSSSSCMAVGYQQQAGGFASQPHALKWDGNSWTDVSPPAPASQTSSLSAVSCDSGTSCMAVGDYYDSGLCFGSLCGGYAPLAYHWDGTGWSNVSPAPVGNNVNIVSAVSCASSTLCVAVGYWHSDSSGSPIPGSTLIERWDGTQWSSASTTQPGDSNNQLLGVSCPSTTGSVQCVAVGSYFGFSSGSGTLVDTFDGSNWSVTQNISGLPSSPGSVSCPGPTACTVVGSSGGQPALSSYDGTGWTPGSVAQPGTGTVLNQVGCPPSGGCMVVGYFNATNHPLAETTPVPGRPVVYSLGSAQGTYKGGDQVVIRGRGFTGATSVRFGTTAASAFTLDSDSQITVTSPPGPPGAVDVEITTAAGTSAPWWTDQYTFQGPPTVTGVNPSSGGDVGGDTVDITGQYFTGATAVSFGSTPASSFVVESDGDISAVTATAPDGTVDVRVTTPTGQSATGPADQFTYQHVTPFEVTALSATEGSEMGGQSLVITGSGFTGADDVAFSGNGSFDFYTSTTEFTIDSDTQITVVVPESDSIGPVTVYVQKDGSNSLVAGNADYRFVAPAISSVNPDSGPLAGGNTVTIDGAGFTGLSGVTFGGVAASSFTVDSDTEVSAVVPAGSATGSVGVSAYNPDDRASTGGTYTYESATTGTTSSTTNLSTAVNPIYTGQAIDFKAVVAPTAGTGAAPSGSVVLDVNGSPSGSSVSLDGNGQATLSATFATPGTYQLAAHYSGDSTYAPSEGDLQVDVLQSGPDLGVSLTHSNPFFAGGSGTYTVTVTNLGNQDATQFTQGLGVVLPQSIVATSATSLTWNCVIQSGGQNVSCTAPDIPAGSTSTVTITVSIPATATGGAAAAVVVAKGDPNSSNNSAVDITTVVQPTGSGSLEIAVASPGKLIAGESADLQLVAVNRSQQAVNGPFSFEAVLPHGFPAGTFLSGMASGQDWTCRSVNVGGRQIITCTTSDAVAALGLSKVIDLSVTPPTSSTGSRDLLSFDLRGQGGAVLARDSGQPVAVVAPVRAFIQAALSGPSAMSAAAQSYTLDLINKGSAPTTGPATATVNLPAGISMMTSSGLAWNCTTPTAPVCTYSKTLKPKERAAPLSLRLAATPEADSPPATISVSVGTVDGVGVLSATAALNVNLPSSGTPILEPTRVASGAKGNYDLTVANGGDTGTGNYPITVTENLPAGVTATASGTGWACQQSGTVLTCTSQAGAIGQGEVSSPVHVSLAGVSGSSGANVAVSGTAQFADAAGLVHFSPVSSSTQFFLPGLSSVSTLSPAILVNSSPVHRGQQAQLTLQITNSGPADMVRPQVFALLLPSGVTLVPHTQTQSPPLTGPNGEQIYNPANLQADAGALNAHMTCDQVSSPDAVVCEVIGLPDNDLTQTTVNLNIPAGAPGDLAFSAGKVFSGLNSQSPLADAETRLAAGGASAVGNPTTTTVPVVGFTADAGPTQQLYAATQSSSGKMTPTTVVLDGTKTGDAGQPETFGWNQTMGPAVNWSPSAAGTQPGTGSALAAFPAGTPFPGGASGPAVYGVRPSFTVPLGSITAPTTFGFQLTVTDGNEVERAQTTVTLDPAGAVPPAPPKLCLVDVTRGGHGGPDGLPPCLTASDPPPTPGDRMVVGTTTPYGRDANGDLIHYMWTLSRPSELRVSFDPLAAFPNGNYASFVWPATPQITVTGVASNGQSNQSTNAPEQASESITEGPDPPPLAAQVPPPTAPEVAGTTVTLTPALTNADYAGQPITYSWTQTSGPSVDLTTDQSSAATLRFVVPPPSGASTSLTFTLVVARGRGSSAITATTSVNVPLAGAAPSTPTISGTGSLQVDPDGTLGLSVVTGAPDATYAWTVVAGGGTLANADTATPTFTAPAAAGQVVVQVAVTSGGQSTTAQSPIQIGAAPSQPDTGSTSSPCAPTSPLGEVFAAVGSDTTLSLGPLTLDVGAPSLPGGGCTPSVALTLNNANGSIGPLSISHASGSLTASGLTLTSGTVSTPGSWGLGSVSIGSIPLQVSFGPLTFAGSLTWSGHIPWLTPPGASTSASTTVTLTASGDFTVSASIPVLDGTATITASVPKSGSSFTAAVHTAGTKLFGTPLSGSGNVTVNGGTVTGSVTLTAGAVSLTSGVSLTSASLIWDQSGIHVQASAKVSTLATASLTGVYVDSSDWALSVVSGSATNGSSLPAGLNLSSTQVSGSLNDTGGNLVYDLKVTVSNPWTVTSGSHQIAAVTNLAAEFSNGTQPTACASLVLTSGSAWLSVSGTATVNLPGSNGAANFTVSSCIDPGTGHFVLTSSASLPHWEPISGVDLAIQGASLTVANLPGGFSVSASGSVNALGVDLTGSVTELPGLSGFLAVLSAPDLSQLDLPLGAGDVIYSTQAVSDVSSVPGVQLDLPSPDLPGLAIAPGFTVLSDFTLPTTISGFLTNDVKMPVSNDVLITAAVGSGTPTLTGTLHLTSGSGLTIFDTCGGVSGCVGTKLDLQSLSLEISLSGSFGVGAAATLSMPEPDVTPAAEESVGLHAQLTIDVPSLSITVAMYTQGGQCNPDGGQLCNLFGAQGLDVSNLAIQGGISFAGPPTPSIGFGATINNLPPSVANAIGYNSANPEPISLVVNISETNPIFALTIGIPNSSPVLSFGSYLEVDDASLVFAPNGGTVGPYTYKRGISLRFDGQVLGVSVGVLAQVTVVPPSVQVTIDIGAVDVGPLSIGQTQLTLDLEPTSVDIDFQGNIAVGSTTLTGHADVKAGLTQAPTLDVSFTGRNLNLGLVDVKTVSIFAAGGTGGSLSAVPGITLGGILDTSVLGVDVTLYGSVQMAVGLGIVGASLYAAPAPIQVGPVTISGNGCHPDPPPVLPAGVTLPANGPCIGAGINLLSATPVTIVLDGSVSARGISASVHGSLDGTGLALTGDINISSLADVAVSGRFYFGTQLSPTSTLPGVTDIDQNGNTVQVQAGDFVIRTSGEVTVPLIGFNVTAAFSMGHLGSDIWLQGTGAIDVLGSGITVTGQISYDHGLHFDLEGRGNVTIDGYTILTAQVTLGDTQIAVSGALNLGPVASAAFGGSLSWNNGLHYDLTGSVSVGSVSVLGIGMAASTEITNKNGPVQATVSVNAALTSLISFDASANFSTAGDLCLDGKAEVLGLTGTATFCSPGEANPGVSLGFSFAGFQLTGSVGTNGFDLHAEVDPGNLSLNFTVLGTGFVVTASWYFDFEVSSSTGLHFLASGSADLQGCLVGDCANLFGVSVTGTAFFDPVIHQYLIGTCVDGTVLVEVEVCADVPGGISIVKPSVSLSGALDDVGSIF